MAIKVMLVDDEPQIRKILRKVIERNIEFEVVCECDNMTDAILQFNSLKPQVIFMDIEIQGSSGIDCAKVISDLEPETKIIFATAHAEYMSNAFEMYAFDYLIKPFNIERIEHTLDRIWSQMHVVKTIEPDTGADKLMIKGKESVNFIDMSDIVMIERENNNTVIYTTLGESFHTSSSLGDIEDRLDKKSFMRSHKSYIINLTQIKSIEPYGRWTYIVRFKHVKKDALLTREKYELIKQIYTI